ncbi:MAG: amino acid adenylation domain-containing protein [Gloeocapsa sp. UFS-A4-WI-NPMV-4B04]|jgi:amino acid adenylation domain-containing protein|nr:amino acid adenylation domain-containing protein [Gloeocapsa sp. UFS-A4-WI-NPMV-4B04]
MQQHIEGFRLSPQQKHLWLLQQGESISFYRVQCAVLIAGNLNINVFKKALQNVVERHEILRTSFHCLPGMTIPLQVIADTYEISIDEHNLNDFSLQEQEAKIELIFDAIKQQPFYLENNSSLIINIIKLSHKKYVLLLGLSALLADSITLKQLVKEISISYSASLQGKEISERSLQYADIAEWQNELFEDSEIGREYWQQQNLTAIPNLHLWCEAKNFDLEFQPQLLPLEISNDLVKEINLLGQEYDVENCDILLACWQILLWKLTQQQDIIIAVADDGRKYEELNQALGLLTKYLPLHCYLKKYFSFKELIKRVSKSRKDAREWQEFFSCEESIKIDDSWHQFCFEFEELPEYCEEGLAFEIYKHYSCIERFKLKLTCWQQKNALIAEIYYNSALYKTEDIKDLSSQFQTLLASAIANPETAISQLEILKSSDRNQLLFEFNQTQADYPSDKCIHQLFAEQAADTPDNIAVVFENQQLTYQELNTRANQLAHYLQTSGVEPETIVGICVERSLDMVVGMLGILKAGGAYLPLDPAMPTERLTLMLQDAQAKILLTQQDLRDRFDADIAQIACLDDWDTIIAQNSQQKPIQVTSKNLAYVIYTSGSTGVPKGVAVEHQQLCNYLYGIQAKLNLRSGSSFATVSSFAADLGNTAIFSSLCTGGCLHIISAERATDADALAEYCRYHPIDYLKIVPSHLAALLASVNWESILPRQRLILGGESAPGNLVEKVQKSAANCQILNHYGPTEATVGVLTYQVEPGCTAETIPLGRAIANTQIYILNAHLQPVPIGVPGELYIGGDNLARGYLHQPELTAAKFIPNPFTQEAGARLYKTGDLARYQRDGCIEFLGRIDDQVKIRGFRIELGEIEAVLRQHSDVEQAVVVAREDVPGDKRLVAYLVLSRVATPDINSIRSFLQRKLPEYMIPSVVTLKTLPLNPNGKVDRWQLPAPDQVQPLAGFFAPRTNVEQVIAGIWAEVLSLERVGIYDNFFELGGHSLLATQVISRLRQAFQVELPLRYLFDSPTVADLAVAIAQKLAEQTDNELLEQMLAELEQGAEQETREELPNLNSKKV